VSLIVFEDSLVENFYPLTLTRGGFELISGTKTLLEGLSENHDVSVFARGYLKDVLKRRLKHKVNSAEHDGEALVVNGLINSSKAKKILGKKGRFVALSGNNIVAARVPPKYVSNSGDYPLAKLATLKEFDRLETDETSLYRHPWELVDQNASVIAEQVEGLSNIKLERVFVNGPRKRAFISPKAEIESPVAIDTRKGPVVVAAGAYVEAMTRLEGPCYIGKGAKVRSARIGEGTSIGDFCVVGGEIENSIIQSYSNKAHLGYLGHSIVGSWVNLGALTTNSNLKTTYGEMRFNGAGTKRIKVGCYIADNAKTAIGTLIIAGKKIGIASHAYGFVTDNVPSFTIYAKAPDKRPVELELQSAIETQKRMMARREVKQNKDDVNLLNQLFTMTRIERRNMKVHRGKFKI